MSLFRVLPGLPPADVCPQIPEACVHLELRNCLSAGSPRGLEQRLKRAPGGALREECPGERLFYLKTRCLELVLVCIGGGGSRGLLATRRAAKETWTALEIDRKSVV